MTDSNGKERAEIAELIYQRMLTQPNVGMQTAAKCLEAAMQVLDEIVSGSTDATIKTMKRPDDVPIEFNYIYWDPMDRTCWVNTHRPVKFGDRHWTCGGLPKLSDERCLGRMGAALPDESNPHECIRKLV